MESEVAAPVRSRRVLPESEKRTLVSRQAESGQSAEDFCRAEGIAFSTFCGWKRRLAAAGKPAFVEVSAPARSAAAVEIVLASGKRVVTSSDCDPVWLAKLVRALDAPSC